jgi:hypothetical protein
MCNRMNSPLNITDIIQKAGGVAVIAARSADLGRDAVYKWKTIGIPDRHWPVLIELCRENSQLDLTAQHLFDANLAVRAAKEQASAA